MHSHGLSSVTNFMVRFVDNSKVWANCPYLKKSSLILSKTVNLEVDLASGNIEVIDLYQVARGKCIVD
jgi:hypothetical protein